MTDRESALQDLTEAVTGLERDCAMIDQAIGELVPQLANLQGVPHGLVKSGAAKVANVIELMGQLAQGAADQMSELHDDVEETAEALWAEGVDALEKLETTLDTAADAVTASLPPCDTSLKEASSELSELQDELDGKLTTMTGELETEMKAVESAARAMLQKVEATVEDHVAAIQMTSLAVDHFSAELANAVQLDVVHPITTAAAKFESNIERMRSEAITGPLESVGKEVQGVADSAARQAAECFGVFDDAVKGFCADLADRSANTSTKSRITQEMTDLVKPVFEDVVQQLPGIKQIASVVGVGT